MSNRKSKLVFGLVVLATITSVVLAGCGPTPVPTPTAGPTPTPKVITQVVTPTPAPITGKLFLNLGPGDVPTIDPALSTDTSSVQIVEETTVGLTRQHEETTATEPGIATEWKQSADGLKWTFKLRNDVTWVKYNTATGKVEQVLDKDKKPRVVTAKDFEYGVKRTLNPKTASDYAYVLNFFIKGGEAFNTADTKKLSEAELKKLEDAVGVKALDDFTIEFTTIEPTGFLPMVAGMWVAHAQPSWLIAEKGDRWTEAGFFQGYGPYTLKEWVHESSITIIANPFWPGTANIPKPKINEVTWYMLDDTPAMANYETGKQDAASVPLADIDRVKADPKLSKELKIAPILCTYYYGFNTKKKPMDNPKVRLAFSMAVDRVSLIKNVTKGDQEPAQWFSRPGLAGAPTLKDYPDLGVKFNAAKAKALLAEAGYPDGKGLPEITLMYNTHEGHKKIAEAIQQMWKTNLGVEVKVANQEWKVYLKTLQTDSPQIWRLGWCQDYPDANNFDKEVFRTDGHEYKATNWSNKKFDDLVDQAGRETDLKKRTELYAQAEKILVADDAAMIPIYWYTRVTLTKPYVKRTFSVLGGLEHIEKWEVAPH
ncbi:MAG: peptide ABC transporter substrate-binding protein [Chloroflexi bacterium]|nr:peptide ABC transporter substrate-binding protein [Chloroflexota bacterium]